ncbi:Membrane-associated guanylate WW and PDZ domain-containing 2 [Brachionus plicatilis]|uniref:Membrane-associated guanylate WW and PDZ domain-containing 2 n=1 Tax=Brachionus plicatilis TaxID=10195 RepID=A0A3M7SQS9_BRAPC|nr:Membrane-associated guanylate WW and PDZ domain-containing 2 [Brachionus plicatilis]
MKYLFAKNLLDNEHNRVHEDQVNQYDIEQSLDYNESEQAEQDYCGDKESDAQQPTNIKQLISNQQNSLNRNVDQFNGLDTNTSIESGVEVIPYGWEKVEDPEYGTFYIDHINKQTTYENPLMIQQQQKMKTFKPAQNPPGDKAPMRPPKNLFFTQDPNQLKGEFIQTSLLKTNNGFGFTIIGANETSEDFLQIKYIVPDGAAARDGKLRQGDVLVYVNNECVLGYTHQDVVEIFQSIPKGNFVDLAVCRGYPLSIDPNDPNIEIMSLAAINPESQAPLAAVDELTSSTLMNSSNQNINQSVKQIPVELELNPQSPTYPDEYYCEEYDELFVPIVKGPKGFGFTIADDAILNHQKVKQILDKERCLNLQENDILLEINRVDLRNMNHNQVVEVLKECVKGQETLIKLKRRKYQITLPQAPSSSSLGNNQETSANTKESTYECNNTTTRVENFEEYKEFRTINSNLKQANGLLFNKSNPPQSNSQSVNYASERRSKTPNILQSSSSNANLQNNFKQSGANPPQLRSKTPTTDRVLFQHTLYDSAPQAAHTQTNDYIYLNGQSSNKSVNDLYSTVNRKPFDQIDAQKHIPIYDSTTNLQHQRVQQNLNKFQQIQNSQKMNPLISNRSKTPGPDMIYFRNNSSSNENFNPYSNYAISSKLVSPNVNTLANRSKTPTADMMYYPSKASIHQPMRQSFNFMDYQNEVENEFVECTNEDLISLFNRMDKNSISITNDVDGNNYLEMSIDLARQESGFGFRIVGGEEEGSQVAVGYIVQGGAAHLDNRIRPNDEIVMIDNQCVLGATHRRVVQLMTIAGLNRRVKLMIRRKISQQQYQMLISMQQQRSRPAANSNSPLGQKYPFTITLFRNGNEGFGFVIISTMNKNGPSIGKIVENSPAERCKRLNVGDKILAVNGINITQMSHIDIVKLIKESGNSITLTIGSGTDNQNYSNEPKQLMQSDSVITNVGSMKMEQNYPSPQFITSPSPGRPTKAIINQNEFHVIELRKQQSGGFGFSIRGGKEFNIPLFVLKLADYGPAALDGRLQVGDQILEINGHEAFSMTHSEAIEIIKSGGNAVNLVIRRTGMPPPSITDIIAANSTATVVSAQQQAQPQLVPSVSTNNLSSDLNSTHLRPKSPYLNQSYQVQSQPQVQHQVKHFSSSGTLINRNF